ncbi:hypothetical protein CTI12_AA114830 [Artemisia annua]|uniref:Uncharacterized protein n=1 Tax=Artemisia annua TaxID=35608 RepID=A0A2U1PTR2_ARTAN|nr:hypothetical protein CTI12_AA114830 [Artemisia annua]
MEALGDRGVVVDSLEALRKTYNRHKSMLEIMTDLLAQARSGVREEEANALLHLQQNMSTGKRLKFGQKVDDRKWSNKVAKEVIFPEIYERYGPNTEVKMQLPAETLEDLRRQVYAEEQAECGETSGSVKLKGQQSHDNGPSSIGNVLENQPIIDETLRKNETILEDYKDVLKKQGSIK